MGYPGAIMFLFVVGGFFLYLLPLFILGVSVHKCFYYAYPRFRGTTVKRFWLPILSGVLTAACGYLYAVFVGFNNKQGGLDVSPFIFIMIVWILPLVFLVAWAILALKAKRSQPPEKA
jgi:hypothetical protein